MSHLSPYYNNEIDTYVTVFSPDKHTADLFTPASAESRPPALDMWLPFFPPWCSFHPCFHDGTFRTVVRVQWRKMHHNKCLWDGVGCCPCHLLDIPSGIKTCVKCIPTPFSEAWQLCSKGPSGSLILGLFRAPHLSTSINVFELFFHCSVTFQCLPEGLSI